MNFTGIDKLVIYGKGKILYETSRDLFKVDRGKIVSFELSEDPKNARKENLNRTDNYYLKYTDNHGGYFNERKLALYVHESEISVSDPVEVVAFKHDGETNYKNEYTLTFMYGATKRIVNSEKMKVTGDWKLPAGAHWLRCLGDYNNSYETVSEEEVTRINELRIKRGLPKLDYNLVHYYLTEESFTEWKRESDYYTRTEKDVERVKRENLAKKFTEVLGSNNHISHYDIDKLLKVFKIEEISAAADDIGNATNTPKELVNA